MGTWLSQAVGTSLGLAYPAYASFEALEKKDVVEQRRWLAFWLLSTVLGTTELLGGSFVSSLPLYWEGKIALLLWMLVPGNQGPLSLFDGVLAPLLARYEGPIDESIQKGLLQAEKKLRQVSEAAAAVAGGGGEEVEEEGEGGVGEGEAM